MPNGFEPSEKKQRASCTSDKVRVQPVLNVEISDGDSRFLFSIIFWVFFFFENLFRIAFYRWIHGFHSREKRAKVKKSFCVLGIFRRGLYA